MTALRLSMRSSGGRTCHKHTFWDHHSGNGAADDRWRSKADYEVLTRNDIFFAEHDGVKLVGDFYAPNGLDKTCQGR
jgi:hypothetical protein